MRKNGIKFGVKVKLIAFVCCFTHSLAQANAINNDFMVHEFGIGIVDARFTARQDMEEGILTGKGNGVTRQISSENTKGLELFYTAYFFGSVPIFSLSLAGEFVPIKWKEKGLIDSASAINSGINTGNFHSYEGKYVKKQYLMSLYATLGAYMPVWIKKDFILGIFGNVGIGATYLKGGHYAGETKQGVTTADFVRIDRQEPEVMTILNLGLRFQYTKHNIELGFKKAKISDLYYNIGSYHINTKIKRESYLVLRYAYMFNLTR